MIWVNIGSGNGLVSSGSKPLPEPVWTQVYVATWRHWVALGFNKYSVISNTLCQLIWRTFVEVYDQQVFVSCWPYQMETFSKLLALTGVTGIHWSPMNSPHKGQWRGALMFSLICAWINDRVNNRVTGDLRRHRTHYDVIVMQRISWNVIGYMSILNPPNALMRFDIILPMFNDPYDVTRRQWAKGHEQNKILFLINDR